MSALSDTGHYFALWFRTHRQLRSTVTRQSARIARQREALHQMDLGIQRLREESRQAKRLRDWALRLAREARAGWWKEAEKRYDSGRKNAELSRSLQQITADEDHPWRGHYLRVVKNPLKSSRTLHITATGRCAVCRTTDEKLTNHHVFGRTMPLVIRACRPCHEGFHRELDQATPGPFTEAMTRTVADAFGAPEEIHHAG